MNVATTLWESRASMIGCLAFGTVLTASLRV
jgi:hypothetical protein